jgi:uncharacterized protein
MSNDRDDPVVIFETVHGSTAHGLARQGSDVDIKGVVVGPRRWYFGSAPAPEQLQLTNDHMRFEVRKVVRLAMESNPTMLELLFTDERHHLTVSEGGALLLQHREAFLSAQAADRFGGYALAQLKRIRTHRGHLLSPPTAPPNREAFELPARTVIPADQLAAAEVLLQEGDVESADVSPNFLELLARERRYKSAKKDWDSYQQWLRQRNIARAELEARFGYDTKHAMHLIRLQRMGTEILRGQGVLVTRQDCEELWAIRDGAWTFEELELQAEKGNAALREAALATALPSRPNERLLDDLCIDIIQRTLSHR